MDVAIGLALVGLTLFASTLSYALRVYSRSRLSACMSESRQRVWMQRLDDYESELQLVSSFIRLTAIMALMIWVYSLYLLSREDGTTPGSFVTPTIIILVLLMIFGLGVPNALATYAGERILARSLGLLWGLRFVLYPIERGLLAVDFVVRRLLGQPEPTEEEESERMEQEILDAVSEGELHGAFDEEQKEMIQSIFELHETAVSAIMTPRTDMVAIPVTATFDEVRETIIAAGHSRIPVYENTLDHIVGVLYAKDLIRLTGDNGFSVAEMMRSVPFVPETKTIDHLLREFRQQKVHLAVVLDEYGGTAGLVTIEDILEELVGEIADEYDYRPPPSINRIDDDTLEVDARVPVHEVNEELDIELPEDGDYETIGGFVFTTLGKLPTTGEQVAHQNVRIDVIDAEERKINRLRIHVDRNGRVA